MSDLRAAENPSRSESVNDCHFASRIDEIVAVRRQINEMPNEDGCLLHHLCNNLYELCDWQGLAATIQQNDPNLEDPLLALYLGYSFWLLSLHERAIKTLRKAMLRHPGDAKLLGLFDEVVQWQMHSQPPYMQDGNQSADDPVILEPVGPQHLHDFRWQYQDQNIAALCCLPDFRSDEHWCEWLGEQWQLEDQIVYAIVHEELGFVGCVSIIVHGRIGMIYYWVGEAFRRIGLARTAIWQLLNIATGTFGTDICYAKVYRQNFASRRFLENLGFLRVRVELVRPNQDEIIYRLGSEPCSSTVDELRGFLDAIDSDLELATILAA